MKNFNLKSLLTGFLIGTLSVSTVTAFAESSVMVGSLAYASGKVEAWVQTKHVNLVVDGKYVEVPEGVEILNYNDRIYTPARVVAESLGATVEWEDARQAVVIEPPEPEIIEVPVESDDDTDNRDRDERIRYPYSSLTIKTDKRNVSISVVDAFFYNDTTSIVFDYENDSHYPIMFDEDNTYIEAEGRKYVYENGGGELFYNTTRAGYADNGISLDFRAIPDDVDEFSLYMSVFLYDGDSFADDEPTVLEYVFHIDAEEQRDDPYR